MTFGHLFSFTVYFKVLLLSTESAGRVSREGAAAAADGGPGSGGFGEDFRRGTGPHSARHKAPSRVLVGTVQHESQSLQVTEK